MMNEIMEKQQQLVKKIIQDPAKKKQINGFSKLKWIETSYRLDGGKLTMENIKAILDGQYIRSKTVQEHTIVKNYQEMFVFLYNCFAIKDKVDYVVLCKANEILSRNEMEAPPADQFRKGIPIVPRLNMIPTRPQDISSALEKMFHKFYPIRDKLDPIMRACYIHNEILRIFPFEKNNEATARAMLNFELLAADLPPLSFIMDVDIYYAAIKHYIKENEPEPFYNMILITMNESLTLLLDMLYTDA